MIGMPNSNRVKAYIITMAPSVMTHGNFFLFSDSSHAIAAIVGDIEQTLRQQPIDENTFIVIVTRGHNHDEQALHAVIDSPARYIGMIGSKRKVKLIFDDLVALGVPAEKLGDSTGRLELLSGI